MYDEESSLEVAYALVLTKNLYGYVLLKYMAVLPWYRGKGVGIAAMRLINKRYADRQGIIAELTSFEDEDGSMIKGTAQVLRALRLRRCRQRLSHRRRARGADGQAYQGNL